MLKKIYVISLVLLFMACGTVSQKNEKDISQVNNLQNNEAQPAAEFSWLNVPHYEEKAIKEDACPKGKFDYYKQYYTFDIPEYFEKHCYITPVQNDAEKYYITRFSRGAVKAAVAYSPNNAPDCKDYKDYIAMTKANRCRRCGVGDPEKTTLNGREAFFRETRINTLPPSDNYGIRHEYIIPAKEGFFVLMFQYANFHEYYEHKADFETIKNSFKGID